MRLKTHGVFQMNKYQLAVVIGRFQPFHKIHQQLIERALGFGETVMVILGSAMKAPNIRNPFSAKMREKMIRSCLTEKENARIIFRTVRDHPYNENNWISEVQNVVRNQQEEILDSSGVEFDPIRHNILLGQVRTALVGHYKDSSSYYLRVFPQWTFEEIATDRKLSKELNATDIRSILFSGEDHWRELVPESVAAIIEDFKTSETFETLKKEFAYVVDYKEKSKFVGFNYPATFVTTDAVCVARGHILLVRRGHQPGLGQLALPGGFVAQGTRLKDNCIKELREETSIGVDTNTLRRAIKAHEVFDEPDRSQRGRTITHAFYIELFPKLEDGLPLVKGGDDADKAMWLPISALGSVEDEFFEDHYDIARYFLDTPANRDK